MTQTDPAFSKILQGKLQVFFGRQPSFQSRRSSQINRSICLIREPSIRSGIGRILLFSLKWQLQKMLVDKHEFLVGAAQGGLLIRTVGRMRLRKVLKTVFRKLVVHFLTLSLQARCCGRREASVERLRIREMPQDSKGLRCL